MIISKETKPVAKPGFKNKTKTLSKLELKGSNLDVNFLREAFSNVPRPTPD